MRTIKAIVLIALIPMISAYAQNYTLDWYVIGSSGGEMSSASYSVNGTVGQPFTGASSSASYTVEPGFWVGLPLGGPSCGYIIGDVNGTGSYNGLDITYGVAYLKGGDAPTYECECIPGNTWYVSGDVNNTCNYNGLDITYGVAYLKGGSGLEPCADCEPSRILRDSGAGLITRPALAPAQLLKAN